MQIKIFESDVSTDDLENKIADWIKELDPKIASTNVNVVPIQVNDDSNPQILYNLGWKYICTIMYGTIYN